MSTDGSQPYTVLSSTLEASGLLIIYFKKTDISTECSIPSGRNFRRPERHLHESTYKIISVSIFQQITLYRIDKTNPKSKCQQTDVLLVSPLKNCYSLQINSGQRISGCQVQTGIMYRLGALLPWTQSIEETESRQTPGLFCSDQV